MRTPYESKWYDTSRFKVGERYRVVSVTTGKRAHKGDELTITSVVIREGGGNGDVYVDVFGNGSVWSARYTFGELARLKLEKIRR